MISVCATNLKCCKVSLLRHRVTLHLEASEEDPGHRSPPCFGRGLSQSLVLVFSPSPQVLEQVDQLPQDPHFPCLGQFCLLQFDLSEDGPKHPAPPFDGVGLSHCLVLSFSPPPQVLLQEE